MELIADRFAALESPRHERRVIDLATGEAVTLLTAAAGGPSDEMRWSVRCDGWLRLHHPAIASLVDYGPLGPAGRFEAWRCCEPWKGSAAEAAGALDRARLFLRAEGIDDDALSVKCVRMYRGRAVVLPPDVAGYEVSGERGTRSAPDAIPVSACALTTIERSAVAAVSEILDHADGVAPRVVAIWAADRGGTSAVIRQLARTARQRGFVPLAASALETAGLAVSEIAGNRTLFLIERRGGREGWRRVVERTLDVPKPHVLLFVGLEGAPFASGVHLRPVAAEVLAAAVRPADIPEATRRSIERFARLSRGCPARFARLLWGLSPADHGRPPMRSVAAERPAAYESQATTPGAVYPPMTGWPAQVASLDRRLTAGIGLLESGRHAPGERAVRAVVGSLARRGAWNEVVRGELALAWSLLKRGRPGDADAVLAAAKEHARRAGEAEQLRLAAAIGHARFDQGCLDEAESTLTAALGAARSHGDAAIRVTCATSLGRCLFWRGRYDEAEAVLERVVPDPGDTAAAIRLEIARSRSAIGRRDLAAGMSRALAALDRARHAREPALVAQSAEAAALAHLWVGDLAAMERDIATCVQAARTAHDPLRALKARLLMSHASTRADHRAVLKRLVGRAGRIALPLTVRARAALTAELLTGPDRGAIVARHVASTRLPALSLFGHVDAQRDQGLPIAADVFVELLSLCQSAEDDAAVLPGICGHARQRVRAAAVALFSREAAGVGQIAVDGGRIDPAIAARVCEVGQPIAPHQHRDRVEGGAPVRYGGAVIGALVARWTVAAPPDSPRVEAILAMTATAAAPAVAAARARRQRAETAPAGELLGVSSAMSDVRSAVERAAAAPFAVLIAGESGSGKELVARALHRRGPRRDRPFCTLNCAALPEDLVDAELFGHARGAFTGAVADRAGVFEEAHTGTLFLDEIGELSPRAQAKVLRTLQEGEVRRVGENIARRVDVRIVSATNRDLRQEAVAGRFRLDLLYRLDVIRITLPPLRDRREDVAVLAEHFWRDAASRVGSRAVLSAQTVAALARYDWPGNVRELQNVLAALAVRSPKRGVVPPAALPPPFTGVRTIEAWTLGEARRTFEERFVRAALVRTGGHRARAAEELGLSRQGLAKLMSRLQITD